MSVKIADEILLLAEILLARDQGSNDTRAGTADEDLLYAIEEAEAPLATLKEALH